MQKHTSLKKEKWGSKDAYIYLCNKCPLDGPDLEELLSEQLNLYKSKK